MNTKIDPIDLADELSDSVAYMQTLLRAAQEKVLFYLSNGPQLGPYREFLAHHASETDALLALMGRFLEKMERDMDTAADLLYHVEPPVA